MSVCNPGDYLDYKLLKGGCYFTDPSENKTFAYRSLDEKGYFMNGQFTLGIPLVKIKDLFSILKEKNNHTYFTKCSLALKCLDAFKDIYNYDDDLIDNIYICIFYCLICYMSYKNAFDAKTMKSYFKAYFPIKFRTNILKLFLEYLPKEKRVQHINTLDKMYTINDVEKSWYKDEDDDDYISDLIKSIFDEYNRFREIHWVNMFEFSFDQTLQHIVFELRSLDEMYKAFHIDRALKQPLKIQKLVEKIYSKLQCEFTWGIELETSLLYYYSFLERFLESHPAKDFIMKKGKSNKNMPSIFITYEDRQLEFQSEVRSIGNEHDGPYDDCAIYKKCKEKDCEKIGIFASIDYEELLKEKLSQKIDIDDIVEIYENLPDTVCEDHVNILIPKGYVVNDDVVNAYTLYLGGSCVSKINVLEFTLGIFNHGSDTHKNENQMSIFKRLYTFIDDYFNHHFERKKSYIKTSKINTSETSQIKSPFKKLKSRHSTKRSMHKKIKKHSTKRSMHKKIKKHSTKRSMYKKMKNV
jgi:hypothetical protein